MKILINLMHKGIAFIVGVLRLYMFRAYVHIFRSNSLSKAATMVFLKFSSGEGCVGSGGVETCCSRGSHYSTYVKQSKIKQSRYRPGVAQRVPGS
jgi:hypothetical protein